MKEKAQRRAFTLVELLVVISIIALLLAILMPSLNKAKEQAKQIVCKNNIRSVAFANFTYSQDYNGSFFIARSPNDPPNGPTKHYYGNIMHNYPEYWPNPNYVNFGRDKNGDPLEPLTAGKYLATKNSFYCPNYFKTFCPEWNQKLAWNKSRIGMILFVNAYYNGATKNMTRMKLVYSDPSNWVGSFKNVPFAKNANMKSSDAIAQDTCMEETKGPGLGGTGVFKMNHKGGVNVTFMDGHSEYVHQKKLDSKNYMATGNDYFGNWSIYPDQM